jgi:hypothetical protein
MLLACHADGGSICALCCNDFKTSQTLCDVDDKNYERTRVRRKRRFIVAVDAG